MNRLTGRLGAEGQAPGWRHYIITSNRARIPLLGGHEVAFRFGEAWVRGRYEPLARWYNADLAEALNMAAGAPAVLVAQNGDRLLVPVGPTVEADPQELGTG